MLDTPRPDSEDRSSPPPSREHRTASVPSSTTADRSSPEDFGHHHDYPALMVGARRKAVPPLAAPGINRQVGIWVPDKLMLERKEWISHIEEFFSELYYHLHESGCNPATPHLRAKIGDEHPRLYLIHNSYSLQRGGERLPIAGAEGQTTRHQRFLLSFTWRSAPVDVLIELFDEYFTLSTSVDLSRRSAAQKPEPPDWPGPMLERAIETFYRLTYARYDEIKTNRVAAVTDSQQEELAGAFDVIYYRVWKALYQHMFPSPLATRAETLGRAFADLRSFVASRERPDFADARKNNRPLDEAIGNGRFRGNDAIRCVDAVRPFMEADAWLHRDADQVQCPEPREFTFTPVVDERFIYGSALGAPPCHFQDRPMPVAYILLAANNCPSEIGLLVDGVNTLGTTRLAALYDFPHLMNAALELRELEGSISEVRRVADAPQADAEIARRLPAFSQRLAEIEQGIPKKSDDRHPQIVGGLPFRVERSRYYQRQFRGLVRGLRIGRIQGFLTYDEAVARRLGGIYQLIDTVGLRHERLREALTGLSQRARSNQQRNLLRQQNSLMWTITDGTTTIKTSPFFANC
jgi:hypothetical protein